MKKANPALMFVLLLAFLSAGTLAGTPAPHLISFQGQALDDAELPLAAGNLKVRIYDAASGGSEIYNSGTDFDGAIVDGVFSVVLG